MPGWYLCKRFRHQRAADLSDDRVEGPFETEEIEAALRKGELTLIDQIFDSRFSSWSTIGEIEAFRKLLERSFATTESRPTWVIFRPENKSDQNKGMEGLLTTEEVQKRLACGELRYSHLIWCEGQAGWLRIGDVEVFTRNQFGSRVMLANPQAIPHEKEQVALDLPDTDELLKNIMTLSRPIHALPMNHPYYSEPAPLDAIGEDLTNHAQTESETLAAQFKPVIFSLLLLIFIGPVPSAFAESRPVSSSPAVSTRVAAGVLEIIPLKLASEKPQLLFQTNADPQETVYVTVKGRSGEILQFPSLHRKFQVRRKPGEVPTLDLSQLPKGSYLIEARLSGAVRTSQIFIGKKDEAFDAEMVRHLKQISHAQQTEKKALFHTAARLEGLAKELNQNYQKLKKQRKQWAAFYRSWQKKVKSTAQPIEELASTPVESIAYPEEVMTFKAALERLGVHAARLDSGVQQSRDIASEISAVREEDFSVEFKQMKQAASKLGAKSTQ